MGSIKPLSEALQEMEQTDRHGRPVPFDLTVVTANRGKKTGGELLELKGCTLARLDPRTPAIVKQAATPGAKKTPRHYQNATRNLLLPNGEVRKVHIRLIILFNQQPVRY